MFNRDMVPVERDDARDSVWGTNPRRLPRLWHAKGRYYAEVPALALSEQSWLIEQIIGLAFDTLGAKHLDVRVRNAEQGRFCATGEGRNQSSIRPY